MKLLYIFPEELASRFAREYHVYRLAESLAQAGCDVTLAAASSPRDASPQRLHDLFGGRGSDRLHLVWLKRQISLGPWKIRSGAWFFRQLDRLVSSTKFDLAFTMHTKAADHLRRRHPTLPLVFEAHEIFADTYSEGSPKYRKLFEMERLIYAHVRGVVTISGYLATCLRQRFPLRVPIRAQHDGIDESMLLEPSGSSDPRELIYAGSLQPWKGVPVAIEAMRLLPGFHLTVLGGSGKPLELLQQSAPPNVTFHGQIPRGAMVPYLRKASIGLMPNLLEPRSALYTFPLKLLEYSAAGIGIVASKIPAFEQLEVEAWVKLFPSGSAPALAAAVRELVKQNIDREAAQAWAGKFLWRNQGFALKEFLESLIT